MTATDEGRDPGRGPAGPAVTGGPATVGPPGRVDTLSPLVRRVLCPNPSLMTGPGTNTYLVGAEEVAVVDPGPDDPVHLERVLVAAGEALRWIVVTHAHPDHAPGARRLAGRTGVAVLGFDERVGFRPDRRVGDGEEVAGGREWQLTALHTPGHSSDHLCFVLDGPDGRLLLSGDHVMDGSTVVIAPPDGDMAAYLDGLRRVLSLRPEPASLLPGHGGIVCQPRARVERYLEHRLAREQALAAVLVAAGSASVDELVASVYEGLDPALAPIARYSVWAHLRKLANDGVVVEEAPGGLDGRWRSVSGSAPADA
jgi:glyoxylase-like metal-dependent hydrolase (beta-lactamase superfamily II)